MSDLMQLCAKGGPVMGAILVLSVLLYARCFHLLWWLQRELGALRRTVAASPAQLRGLQRRQEAVHDAFRQQRMVIGAMIAAAPLLGLLGTVSGMTKTFDSLANRLGEKSMEGLAHGISEVLVATEAGLAVALPAMLLVYLGHRAVQRGLQSLNRLECSAGPGGAT